MKLPLKTGLPLLVVLWVTGEYVLEGTAGLAVLVAAMAVALWTAYSLPIAPKHPGDDPPAEWLPTPPPDEEASPLDGDLPQKQQETKPPHPGIPSEEIPPKKKAPQPAGRVKKQKKSP